MSNRTTIDRDVEYQYIDGRSLLSAAIVERDQLLQELETVARAPQGKGTLESFPNFNLVKARSILYDLALKMERIDSLIIQINGYAEQCDMPLVGLAYEET